MQLLVLLRQLVLLLERLERLAAPGQHGGAGGQRRGVLRMSVLLTWKLRKAKLKAKCQTKHVLIKDQHNLMG